MNQSNWPLAHWLDYLLAIHPTEIDMTLDRIRRVYQRFQLQWNSTTVITVGGTNGKGSTCRFLEAALQAKGYKVGVYSSPHLIDYEERIRINGDNVSADDVCQAFLRIERARGDETLTYFEFGTLAALLLLNNAQPDYMMLEVGLGGRLDATNIIDADIAVITSIGVDHQAYLGDTRSLIAIEKAGIFRPDIPLVIGDADPPDTLTAAARKLSNKVLQKGHSFTFTQPHENAWTWRSDEFQLSALPLPMLPLENMATALAVLQQLGHLAWFTEHATELHRLLQETKLPGRLQWLKQAPNWFADVGHNPHAAQHLRKQLEPVLSGGTLYIIVGMMKDKAIEETLSHFFDLQPRWLTVSLDSPRAAKSHELGQVLASQRVVGEFDSVEYAVKELKSMLRPADTVLVFGSFVTVADLLTLSGQQRL
ncbi:bifunctional tetrahydrofolate synthase/dihydrofolate synthase [Alteromonas oceanisediminis]|uniref:bifunctional tetrahydrofolate synthase/dihydrofolate synthase n=1 Tax=Alteromonas oceanisediminis TaxID=2836180 RepID=UPI001BDA5D2E|nr:bifunctional tetrahydrofolate synthase/dihydrofolate synthase [Alteromonas oceanisediminis]MBT0587422.1 bifunctional tetrahydrofolate synthase/dihydrofolate synthase [Alteromonas oceanisediminis]